MEPNERIEEAKRVMEAEAKAIFASSKKNRFEFLEMY